MDECFEIDKLPECTPPINLNILKKYQWKHPNLTEKPKSS